MSDDKTYRLAKIIMIAIAVQVLVIIYVFWTDYDGRQTGIEASRRGCERDKITRMSTARGFRIAEQARRAEGEIELANRYHMFIENLERVADINCVQQYPHASFFP